MKRSGLSRVYMLAIILACLGLCLLSMLAFLLYWGRNPKQNSSSSSSMMKMKHQFLRVSYDDLSRATNGFSPKNLIGSGRFGSVYKGFLDQVERPVAVKVLKLEQEDSSKTFNVECKVLSNIKHRNLVKMLTYCSSLDYKLNEFKALIFEFIENGSLEKWLHPDIDSENQSRNLNLVKRLKIAIDVASALHYLHDLCKRPIIHCDLKPSNVLLDEDMVARVCDFGVARLLSTANDSSQSMLNTYGMKGTIGYAAPEYGMGCEASKEGDAYSYGILVLEMFTGKRPIDEMFIDGLNLHEFVKKALPQKLEQIVDRNFLAGEIEETKTARTAAEEKSSMNENLSRMRPKVQKCLLSVLEIGVACSAESPKERMSMRNASRLLHLTKKTFLKG